MVCMNSTAHFGLVVLLSFVVFAYCFVRFGSAHHRDDLVPSPTSASKAFCLAWLFEVFPCVRLSVLGLLDVGLLVIAVMRDQNTIPWFLPAVDVCGFFCCCSVISFQYLTVPILHWFFLWLRLDAQLHVFNCCLRRILCVFGILNLYFLVDLASLWRCYDSWCGSCFVCVDGFCRVGLFKLFYFVDLILVVSACACEVFACLAWVWLALAWIDNHSRSCSPLLCWFRLGVCIFARRSVVVSKSELVWWLLRCSGALVSAVHVRFRSPKQWFVMARVFVPKPVRWVTPTTSPVMAMGLVAAPVLIEQFRPWACFWSR